MKQSLSLFIQLFRFLPLAGLYQADNLGLLGSDLEEIVVSAADTDRAFT
jgi:hypothetical protein